MILRAPKEVFVTDGYPIHTYVSSEEGKKEKQLREGLEQQNKIISINGPSKSGKTTLCDNVFGTERGVHKLYVTGDLIDKPEAAWLEAFKQATKLGSGNFYALSPSERIDQIIESDLPLIIDDFHYIPREVQHALCQQMKNAAYAGLRIICLSVPHRGDDPIRSNSDLSGRFFSIDFRNWEPEDLKKIAQLGFPKVGFPMNDEFNSSLAIEALHSPQLMQTLCFESCRVVADDKPLPEAHPDPAHIPEIKQMAIRSYNLSTQLQTMESGPPTRGSERILYRMKDGSSADVYQCLVAAIRTDPPFLQIGIDELWTRLQSLLNDSREPNIRSALQQYEKLFGGPDPLEWDDEKRQLTVNDPHFCFYLRNIKPR